MAQPLKKVLLFIVEGPSEQEALGRIMHAYFTDPRVEFAVFHGDITSQFVRSGGPDPDTVCERLREWILNEIGRYEWRWTDLLAIVHLVDADGAFIPDDRVILDENPGIETQLSDFAYHESSAHEPIRSCRYEIDRIVASDPASIRRRNTNKQKAIRKLLSRKYLTYKRQEVPYRLFFLSRNLEHALYDRIDDVTDEEKEQLAFDFSDQHAEDIPAFLEFIHSDEVAVRGSYRETWDYLREGLHSLERGSNLHLLFDE